MADLTVKYGVAPAPAEAKALPSTAMSLTTKQAAIIMIGQWVLLDLAQSGTDFGVGVLPSYGKYVTSPGWGTIGIFKTTKHPNEAYLFWKWICDPANSLETHKAGLWMPLMKKYYTDEALVNSWAKGNKAHPEGYIDAVMKPALTNLKQHPSSYVKNFPKIDALVQPALERMYLGQETAEQAMKNIEPEVNKLIEGRYVK
jgi:multiple sugar transport system substrate-binding protein